MPQIAQHEAAELWELARDHFITATTLNLLTNAVQDPQLKSVLWQHGQRYFQIGQQLQQFIQQPGQAPISHTAPSTGATWINPYGGGVGSTGYSAGSSLTAQDVLAAATCLQECKNMAVKSMIGATEASQPARNFLFQIAGEHLQMAETHYHWLEQRGLYASPKADHQSIQEYIQKLNTISSAAMEMQQLSMTAMPQAVAQAMPTLQGLAHQPLQGQSQGMDSGQWAQYAQQYAPQLTQQGQQPGNY